jgi:hypothetical protein
MYATTPASMIASINSEVATGRRMNRRDGFISRWPERAFCSVTEELAAYQGASGG